MTNPKIPQEEKKVKDSLKEQSIKFDHQRITAGKGQGRLRIDKFLMNRIEQVSRNQLQKAIKNGYVLVNGQPTKSSYQVKPEDVISVILPYRTGSIDLQPEQMELDIVHEDEQLIIVNKKAGRVVHPGVGHRTGTLVQGLLYHFNELPHASDSDIRPGLVHRLDKETSGTLIVAKTPYAMQYIGDQFANRTVKKSYLCLVWGDVEEDTGVVKGAIGRHPKHRKKMTVKDKKKGGKPASTKFEVLERLGFVTLLACYPTTGRTHQIRVHCKHINHPIFNDSTYGGNKILRGNTQQSYQQFMKSCFKLLPRQALHAHSITFKHPNNKSPVTFKSPLPPDFKSALTAWRDYIKELYSS